MFKLEIRANRKKRQLNLEEIKKAMEDAADGNKKNNTKTD